MIFAAYVDLKKAFDPLGREALWNILRVRGIPARTIELMNALYSGTESDVKCGKASPASSLLLHERGRGASWLQNFSTFA